MNSVSLSVREIEIGDVALITDYWLNASASYLHGMGADKEKVPPKEYWYDALTTQINTPLEQKQSYCTIWLIDGKAAGHCNVNKIRFGEEAFMHLHLWYPDERKQGMGTSFVRMSLPFFFDNLQLQHLYCEPYALNKAPNRALEKTGFHLVKEYVTTPGFLNFEQPVKRWHLSRERFREMEQGV